jgi:hypothetical protein
MEPMISWKEYIDYGLHNVMNEVRAREVWKEREEIPLEELVTANIHYSARVHTLCHYLENKDPIGAKLFKVACIRRIASYSDYELRGSLISIAYVAEKAFLGDADCKEKLTKDIMNKLWDEYANLYRSLACPAWDLAAEAINTGTIIQMKKLKDELGALHKNLWDVYQIGVEDDEDYGFVPGEISQKVFYRKQDLLEAFNCLCDSIRHAEAAFQIAWLWSRVKEGMHNA